MKRFSYLMITVLLCAALLCLCACGKQTEEAAPAEASAAPVTEEPAAQTNFAVPDAFFADDLPSALPAEEALPEAAQETTGEAPESPLDAELAALEEQAAEINAIFEADASSQTDLNFAAADLYQLWDDELNSLWGRLNDAASADYMAGLLAEQRDWIADKEAKVAEEGAQYEGGSIRPMVEDKLAADITRTRCYYLADKLGAITGQASAGPIQGYAGTFTDNQGTPDVYSEMHIQDLGNDRYDVTISIYRLTQFTGTAYESGGGLIFVDEEYGVRGVITVTDYTGTFIVTASEWELVSEGETFEFPNRS